MRLGRDVLFFIFFLLLVKARHTTLNGLDRSPLSTSRPRRCDSIGDNMFGSVVIKWLELLDGQEQSKCCVGRNQLYRSASDERLTLPLKSRATPHETDEVRPT